MKITETGHLTDSMLDAALGRTGFDDVLRSMVGHFGGAGGVIFELNRKTGAISNWIGPGLEAGAQDYIEHLNGINPRMRYSLRHAPGHIVHESLFTTERAMARHEFYDAIQKLTDVRYFLGSRLFDDGDVSVFHSIEFTRRHGHPDADKIAAFHQTSANLAESWQLARSQAGAEAGSRQTAGEHFLFDHLSWAIFSVTPAGFVSAQNSSADALVSRGDALLLRDGRLSSANRELNGVLTAFLRDTLGGRARSILIPTGANAVPLVMQSVPAPGNKGAYIFVRDPRQSRKYLDNILPSLFGLSLAEVRVIKALLNGTEPHLAAQELGLSRYTVRNHLQAIYRKTGTRNRSELMAQILGIIDI
jgi:DNA-binding CsgD family transcriptional regulator